MCTFIQETYPELLVKKSKNIYVITGWPRLRDTVYGVCRFPLDYKLYTIYLESNQTFAKIQDSASLFALLSHKLYTSYPS